jgi:hypothetical protein
LSSYMNECKPLMLATSRDACRFYAGQQQHPELPAHIDRPQIRNLPAGLDPIFMW